MITEIFVEGKKLDITDDISSLITFAIDDVRDFSSRQTTFSKTVVLPGTANNNAIFGNIFDTGISNDYDPLLNNIGYNFNAAVSAACIIFQDNLQTFKGSLRLMAIDKYRGMLTYEVALNGDLTTLNVALSAVYLTDLDFSAYDTILNGPNIVASWDNAPGSGVYFPLIDYGTYSTDKHNWDFGTFRPALYVKEYIDKMFAAANFRYNCDLFETDRFKRMIVPHNQKQLTILIENLNSFSATSPQNTTNAAPQVHFPTFGAGAFTASFTNSRFTNSTATEIDTVIGYEFVGTIASGSGTFEIRHNGVVVQTTPLTGSFHVTGSITVPVDVGEYLEFWITPLSDPAVVLFGQVFLKSAVPITAPASYGSAAQINNCIPINILQIDFLVSIVKLFNLYVYEDKFDDRLINIKPFVDFYEAGTGSAVDWTYKVDRNSVIKISPMSELTSSVYNFNYADDSDYYNALYNTRFNQPYGAYIFNSDFDFTTQVTTLDLIFAPTPLVGYDSEDKVYSTIFKRTGPDTAPVEENVDSVIRILQTKKVTGVTSWSITTGGAAVQTTTNYGYAGHLDDPDAPSNDLNFGALQQLFFTLIAGDLTKTQFNVYWSGYMAEITDKDSKLFTASLYLNPADIFNIDFAKYVYVDGDLFRLNKITDYNATVPSTCMVELLKVIQTSYSFPPALPVTPDYLLADPGDVLLSGTDKLLYD